MSFAENRVFRFHQNQFPQNLNPVLQASNSSYLLGNLYRNLLKYDHRLQIQPDLAEKCELKKNTTVRCQLIKNLKWSNGETLSSEDFLNTYKWILNPENKALRADILFSIKGALDFYNGKNKWEAVGIKTPSPDEIIFTLEKEDPLFLDKLTLLNISPFKKDPKNQQKYLTQGPFKIKQINTQEIQLTPNSYYFKAKNQSPVNFDVQIKIINDDSTALKLYQKNELDFLRRVSTNQIPLLKNTPDFFENETLRFDYIGLSPQIPLPVRKLISQSLDYQELRKLFSSTGLPGCPGIPESWSEVKKWTCHELSTTRKTQLPPSLTRLDFAFSLQGGEDHKKLAEWLQIQLNKNAQINLSTKGMENKYYNTYLKDKKPLLFRKGISLELNHCAEALRPFTTNDSENFLSFSVSEMDQNYKKLLKAKKPQDIDKYCSWGINYLMENAYIIPTGPIYFSMLKKSYVKNFNLNGLNQLDLSLLEIAPH